MQEQSIAEQYRIRFMIHRGWKRNINSDDVVKQINETIGRFVVSPKYVQYCYTRFETSDTEWFDPTSALRLFCGAKNKEPMDLSNSLLLLNDDDGNDDEFFTVSGTMHIKNERYLIQSALDEEKKSFIAIYDLFRGIKKKNFVPFNITYTGIYVINDLLLFKQLTKENSMKLFKMDYSTLTIKLWKEFIFPGYANCSLVFDQLDSQKFVIWDQTKFVKGLIQQDGEIVLNEDKFFGENADERRKFCYGWRLIDNKFQHIVTYTNALQIFREHNLDTNKKKDTNASIDLNEDKLTPRRYWTYNYFWAGNRFYGAYHVDHEYTCILAFDTEIIKWFKVQLFITNSMPKCMFVNDDGILMLCVGNGFNKTCGFYRSALRKPEKLVDLTWLFALRESNLYLNHRYVKVARQLKIQV